MDRDKIIQDLYQAFKNFSRPENFTDYEHCPECYDHNETMKSARLTTLNSEHFGTPGYNPFNFLTAEAIGHFMPRLLELAITGVKTKDNELFLHNFLFHLAPDKDFDRFKDYNEEQISAVLALYDMQI
ncbi:MAG: hypothetical protein D6B25_00055 [Desulfobulbaceae bacterium]|nr:MAG: hypothetical protein D6B25_00055 [Desulfobulbaceae bacterium]